MDVTPRTEDGAGGEGREDTLFFIEGASSSDDDLEFDQKALRGERSPPLLLAFSVTRGPPPPPRDDASSPAASLDAQAEEEAIEEWMILEGGEQPGDSSIHLNLSYWTSPEEDSPDEGEPIIGGVLGTHGAYLHLTSALHEMFTVCNE